ncbi:hypothetical protein PCL_09701 [Purpureocillium lilacinum]|uniref:Uncharacterized protein n=1 Tax=Purpureocillium lilacinum TaxID=33203 RepID=A0A2U3EDV3_PURLI|nr:hypothetical protein PCL_09701 [Purpureocillium lilacinum]
MAGRLPSSARSQPTRQARLPRSRRITSRRVTAQRRAWHRLPLESVCGLSVVNGWSRSGLCVVVAVAACLSRASACLFTFYGGRGCRWLPAPELDSRPVARRASLRKALAFHGGFLGDLSLNPMPLPMVADAPWDITHPRRPVLPPLPMTAIMDEYVHSGAVRPVAKGQCSPVALANGSASIKAEQARRPLSDWAPRGSRRRCHLKYLASPVAPLQPSSCVEQWAGLIPCPDSSRFVASWLPCPWILQYSYCWRQPRVRAWFSLAAWLARFPSSLRRQPLNQGAAPAERHYERPWRWSRRGCGPAGGAVGWPGTASTLMAAGLNKAHTTVDNGGGPGTEAFPAWPCRITVPSSTRKRRRTPVWKFVRQGPPPGPRPTFANPYSISSSASASVFAWGSRAGDRKKGTRTTPHHTPQTEESRPHTHPSAV